MVTRLKIFNLYDVFSEKTPRNKFLVIIKTIEFFFFFNHINPRLSYFRESLGDYMTRRLKTVQQIKFKY